MEMYIREQVGVMSNSGLDELMALANARREYLRSLELAVFNVGDVVKFSSRKGAQYQGVITQINKKSVGIKTDTGMNWRVSPSFLTKVPMFGDI